tara:strand:- start:406 stop:756 length:351 start_codon:yes stop_codon:yes gene_type:complete
MLCDDLDVAIEELEGETEVISERAERLDQVLKSMRDINVEFDMVGEVIQSMKEESNIDGDGQPDMVEELSDYEILIESGAGNLSQKVQVYMRSGYKPLGAPFSNGVSGTWYQAMVR